MFRFVLVYVGCAVQPCYGVRCYNVKLIAVRPYEILGVLVAPFEDCPTSLYAGGLGHCPDPFIVPRLYTESIVFGAESSSSRLPSSTTT